MIETVQARSCWMPHLGGILKIAVAELPPSMVPEDKYSADAAMAETVEFVFGVPSAHVITHSRWSDIRARIEQHVGSKDFASQMGATVAGNDPDEKARFESELASLKSTIEHVGKRVPYPTDFATCMIRNVVLSRSHQTARQLGPLLGLSGYVGGQSVAQSLYRDLQGFDEITLRLWTVAASAALNDGVLPSAKNAFDELEIMELPFSGSPQIKAMTLAAATAACRGCGIYMLSQSAYAGGAELSHDFVTALLTSVEGAGLALVFISFGAVLPDLEQALKRGMRRLTGSKHPRD